MDQIMYFLGNVTGTDAKTRKYVREKFDLVKVLERLVLSQNKIPWAFARNYVWVAKNLALEPRSLSLEEVKGLMNIFCEFFQPAANLPTNEEEILIEIV